MNRALIALLGLIAGGCATTQTKNAQALRTSWESARQNAASMNGREVSMCGWFDAEFEVCTLAPDPHSNPETAAATQIWLSPKSDVCALEKVTTRPTKGWADVSGTFQHSSDPNRGFGQFGTFRNAIGHAEVRMRDAACDK